MITDEMVERAEIAYDVIAEHACGRHAVFGEIPREEL